MNIRVAPMTEHTVEAAAPLLGWDGRIHPVTRHFQLMGVRWQYHATALAPIGPGRREVVVGACRYTVERLGRAADGTDDGERHIDVKQVVVAEQWRRRGVGRAMVEHLKGKLDAVCPTLWIPVPLSDMPTLAWLKAIGGWQTVHGTGPDGDQDIVWFKHSIRAREEVAA